MIILFFPFLLFELKTLPLPYLRYGQAQLWYSYLNPKHMGQRPFLALAFGRTHGVLVKTGDHNQPLEGRS